MRIIIKNVEITFLCSQVIVSSWAAALFMNFSAILGLREVKTQFFANLVAGFDANHAVVCSACECCKKTGDKTMKILEKISNNNRFLMEVAWRSWNFIDLSQASENAAWLINRNKGKSRGELAKGVSTKMGSKILVFFTLSSSWILL